MGIKFSNFGEAKLSTPPTGTGGLSFTVQAGKGALFPTLGVGDYFFGVFANSTYTTFEIVKVEARSGDNMTIATGGRGLDGTTAQTWTANDIFYAALTQSALDEFYGHVSDPTAAHAGSAISNTPTGALTATNVQAAIDELEGIAANKQPLDAELTAWAAKTAPAGAVVGTTDAQTITNKEHTRPAITAQTLTDGASIAWDMASGNFAEVTLAGNRAMSNPTNVVDGSAVLIVKQDGSGTRTLTWGNAYKWSAGVAPTLTTAGGAVDVFSFIVKGGVLYGSFNPDVK